MALRANDLSMQHLNILLARVTVDHQRLYLHLQLGVTTNPFLLEGIKSGLEQCRSTPLSCPTLIATRVISRAPLTRAWLSHCSIKALTMEYSCISRSSATVRPAAHRGNASCPTASPVALCPIAAGQHGRSRSGRTASKRGHYGQGVRHLIGGQRQHKGAFVGQIKRFHAVQFTQTTYRIAHRDCGFLQSDTHASGTAHSFTTADNPPRVASRMA